MNLKSKNLNLLVAATLTLLCTTVLAQGPADPPVSASTVVSSSNTAIPEAPAPSPA